MLGASWDFESEMMSLLTDISGVWLQPISTSLSRKSNPNAYTPNPHPTARSSAPKAVPSPKQTYKPHRQLSMQYGTIWASMFITSGGSTTSLNLKRWPQNLKFEYAPSNQSPRPETSRNFNPKPYALRS